MSTVQSEARRRLTELLDNNSLVELGAAITARNTDFNLSSQKAPGDGIITGYGVIDGRLVYVYSQDSSILGGTIGEMHAKKIISIYELAMKTASPVIGLIDCAGFRLQEASDALDAFGKIYRMQAKASGYIPQIMAVFGSCGGGMAISASMADFCLIEKKKGRMFINAPNTLDGNSALRCDTSDAAFLSNEAGTVDFVGNEDEVIAMIRELISLMPSSNEDDVPYDENLADDLNRACSGISDIIGDGAKALKEIADHNIFLELKKDFAKDVVVGLMRLNGSTVGAIANRNIIYDSNGKSVLDIGSKMTPEGADKAEQFIRLCDAFNIPIFTLASVTGFRSDKNSEKYMGRAASRLASAFANATIPKVCVVVGKAYGSAYVIMNSKAVGADLVFAWESASIGMMDANSAARIMYEKSDSASRIEMAKEYENLQSDIRSAAARGYIDGIISPSDTRKYIIGALEMLYTKKENPAFRKHTTI